MKQKKIITQNKFSQLKFSDREKIELWYNKDKFSITQIATLLHKNKSTISREIKIGTITTKYLKSDPFFVDRHFRRSFVYKNEYSAVVAQEKRNINCTAKGKPDKLKNNHIFAKLIASFILKKYSPAAALKLVEQNFPNHYLSICEKTLYRYIDKGWIPFVTNKNLLVKCRKKKRKYKQTRRKAGNNFRGTSIVDRPENINERQEFGHWEIDLIVGKKSTKTCLLTLTERKTRFEIIELLANKKQETIISAVDKIERRFGAKNFRQYFKTITADNGVEFLKFEELEKSCLCKKQRTKIYYAHPFSSYERGTNEVTNKFVRRYIPKGINIKPYTKRQIKEIEQTINTYPRKILNYENAQNIFKKEVEKLSLSRQG